MAVFRLLVFALAFVAAQLVLVVLAKWRMILHATLTKIGNSDHLVLLEHQPN